MACCGWLMSVVERRVLCVDLEFNRNKMVLAILGLCVGALFVNVVFCALIGIHMMTVIEWAASL